MSLSNLRILSLIQGKYELAETFYLHARLIAMPQNIKIALVFLFYMRENRARNPVELMQFTSPD